MSGVSVRVEVDLEDVLSRVTDDDLESNGLCRLGGDISIREIHQRMFEAIERGDTAGMLVAAEQIAWEGYGKILVARVAA